RVAEDIEGRIDGDVVEGAGADTDIAEARIALNGTGDAEFLSPIIDHADVDVGVGGPSLEGAENLCLPCRGGQSGERAEKGARLAIDGGAGGGNAQREPRGVEPGRAEHGLGNRRRRCAPGARIAGNWR